MDEHLERRRPARTSGIGPSVTSGTPERASGSYCTTIVAVIIGCTVQWYGNVPVLLNVTLLLPPGGMLPVSQAPESLVAVCGTPSEFCHVTVVPFATVSVEGPKAMLYAAIVFGDEFVVPPELLAGALEYGLVIPLEHPPRATSPKIAARIQCRLVDFVMSIPPDIVLAIECDMGRAATMMPTLARRKR